MKTFLFVAGLALSLSLPAQANTNTNTDTAGKGEIKRVCHPKKDKDGKEVKGKDGKVVEECKDVKVRKKLEATEIPPAPPKK